MNHDPEARAVAYGAAFLAVSLACGLLIEHWSAITAIFAGWDQ